MRSYGTFYKISVRRFPEIFLLSLLIIGTSLSSNNQVFGIKSSGNSAQTLSSTDSTFRDFILQFGFDGGFQKERIKFPLEYVKLGIPASIEKCAWKHDRLYVDLEAITDVSNGIEPNEKSDERVFTWINQLSKESKNYCFKKLQDRWYLVKIEVVKNPTGMNKEDFYSFLSRFCKDSVFQKQRIKFPLDMTYLDDEYNEVKENRTSEKWRYQGLYYQCDSIATIYYDFQRVSEDTDIRILNIDGVENGINVIYTFKRIDNQWIMVKYEDYST